MAVTLKQIAEVAGVSRPTANLIVLGKGDRFSPATRARVMEAVKALNYRPNLAARGLSERKSYLLAAVVSDEYANQYAEFSTGFQQRVLARGYLPVTALTSDAASQRAMLARMAEVRVGRTRSVDRSAAGVVEKNGAWRSSGPLHRRCSD